MAKNSIKKNYIFNVSYQIFAMLVPLITTPYISRVLEVSGTGTYSYTYAMVRYFWLAASLGTATYGIRNIGMYQDDEKQRTICFWNVISLKAILSLIFGILYYAYVLIIADNKLIASLQGINLLVALFDITWFFQGMERFDKVAIKNFIIKVLTVVFIFLIIKTSDDLWKYTLGLGLFLLLGNIVLWIDAKKYLINIKRKKITPFKNFKLICLLFIPSVATQIFSVIDKSMIGWFTSNSLENGYYEQAIKIVDMALVLITAISSVMMPKVSREYKKKKQKEIVKCLDKSFRFTFALAVPMILGLLSISKIFVPKFFGETYSNTIPILNTLSILFLFMGINSVSGNQYLISTEQQDKHTKFLMIGGTVNVFINCILIPKYFAIGAAIGSVAGECTITFLELGFLYKTKQYNILAVLKKTWKYFVCGIVMFIVIKVILYYLSTIIGVLLSIVVGGISYGILLLLLRDDFVLDETKKIFSKIKRGAN